MGSPSCSHPCLGPGVPELSGACCRLAAVASCLPGQARRASGAVDCVRWPSQHREQGASNGVTPHKPTSSHITCPQHSLGPGWAPLVSGPPTRVGVLQLLLQPGEGGAQRLGVLEEHLVHDEHRLLPDVRLGVRHLPRDTGSHRLPMLPHPARGSPCLRRLPSLPPRPTLSSSSCRRPQPSGGSRHPRLRAGQLSGKARQGRFPALQPRAQPWLPWAGQQHGLAQVLPEPGLICFFFPCF